MHLLPDNKLFTANRKETKQEWCSHGSQALSKNKENKLLSETREASFPLSREHRVGVGKCGPYSCMSVALGSRWIFTTN